MRVALDVRPVSPRRPGGTHVYTRELALALLRTRPDLQLLLVAAEDTDPRFLADAASAGGESVSLPGASTPRVQLGLPALLRQRGVSVFHSPGTFLPLAWSGRKVLTVHDLNVYTHPTRSWRPGAAGRWLDQAVNLGPALAAADRVLCVSAWTAALVARAAPWQRGRTVVVPEAPDPFFTAVASDDDIAAAAVLAGPAPYLLAVGALTPQKRLDVLVEALAVLDERHRPQLLLAGPDPTGLWPRLARLAGERGVLDLVRYLGPVPRGVLRGLYAGALAVVVASDGEGFGLPVAEAMAAGAAVVAADRQALPEVLGGAGLLFDPDQLHTLLAQLVRLQVEPGLRAELGRAGRARASAFSWYDAARATAAVYEEAASR